MTQIGDNTRTHLRSFIERIERLDEEIKALNADKSEVFKEARFTGYDVKVMREVLKLRRMDPHDRTELETLVEVYMREIGTPIALRVHAQEEPLKVDEVHDPETGEILTGTETELVAGSGLGTALSRQSGEGEARDSAPTNSRLAETVDEPDTRTADEILGDDPIPDWARRSA